MYAFIKGPLISASPSSCVVEAAGVGYKIHIPASVFGKLPQNGSEVLLHTSYVIREMSQSLYGFLQAQERDVFEVLLGVTGIGPKIALSIIGHLLLHDLQRAIACNDISALCKIPGIGKKTSERLIIELRDKLITVFPPDPSDLAVHLPAHSESQTVMDAMSALINLGYNQNIAQKAIKKTLSDAPDGMDLPTLITTALKHI